MLKQILTLIEYFTLRRLRGHSPIFRQKHTILGLNFDFALTGPDLFCDRNHHCKSKNDQIMSIEFAFNLRW